MRKVTLMLSLIAVLLAVMVMPANAQTGDGPTLAEILIDASTADEPQFTTLLAAAQAAGLMPLLDQSGPYTVFAPTDEAFAATLAELELTQEDLLADPNLLASTLLYHIVPGTYLAPNVVDLMGYDLATAYWGSTLSVSVEDGGAVVMVDDATVLQTDIVASNGVVHVIDRVLLPVADEGQLAGPLLEGEMNVVELAVSQTEADQPEFVTLVTAITEAGLAEMMASGGPCTIFAPTDEAFAAYLEANGLTADDLLADPEALADILTAHVVPLNYFSGDLALLDGALLGTRLAGHALQVGVEDGTVTINGATVIQADFIASNGVIHVVDAVLVPTSTSAWAEAAAAAPEAAPEATEVAPEATEAAE